MPDEIRSGMQIILFDIDEDMIKYWKQDFLGVPDVEIEHMEFTELMNSRKEIDTIVSAANSFGIMDGGLDQVYIDFFGEALQTAVQNRIIGEYLGEQPVGTSIETDIPGYPGKILIHTPTMRVPQPIQDATVIYSCMRSSLVCAVKNQSKEVLIPAFGHATGRISAKMVSRLMFHAYNDVKIRLHDKSFNTWQRVMNASLVKEETV